MKKLIIAAALTLSLVSTTFAAPPASTPSQFCGWDFARSILASVPPTFCWARQDQGNQTYNGFLSVACSGQDCKKTNNIFNSL